MEHSNQAKILGRSSGEPGAGRNTTSAQYSGGWLQADGASNQVASACASLRERDYLDGTG